MQPTLHKTPDAPKLEGISVCLITKNCAKSLDECLESLKNFLKPQHGDEVVIVDTGSTDRAKNSKTPATISVAKRHGARVISRPDLTVSGMADLVREFLPEHAPASEAEAQHADGFLSDFAAARQIGADAAKNDLIFWIDADDVLVGGNRLREMAAQFFSGTSDARQLFMAYDYSFSEDGACDTVLWRERLVRKAFAEWRGVCHETLVPRDKNSAVTIAKVSDLDSKIIHKHTRGHLISDIRNYAILRRIHDTAEKAGEWIDPRWQFYIGNACRGLSKLKEAVKWYFKVLRRSGNREDRVSCFLNIAYAYLYWDRPWRAIDWAMQCLKADSDDARAYFVIARAHFNLRRHPDCLLWTNLGNAVGKPKDNLSAYDPGTYSTQPAVFAAQSLCELKRYTEAKEVLSEALSERPGLKPLKDLLQFVESKIQIQALTGAVATVSSAAFSQAAVKNVILAVRPEIRAQVPDLQLETFVPKIGRSVTFLCGPTHEPWSDHSFEAGIGGSEKMVILMSRAFAASGVPTTVYCEVPPQDMNQTISGVTYKTYQAFNPELSRDTLIIWRSWQWLDLPLKANKIYIDLHDVQDPSNITPARLAKLSGAIFKSEYHADPVRHLFADCPEKLIISKNAVSPALFPEVTEDSTARNTNRLLFCSAGDRGLKRALLMFQAIRQANPKAEMEVCYGFNPLYWKKAAEREYQFFVDEAAERHMADYAEECFDLAEKLGVKMHGRIGSVQLSDLMRASSILLYPTGFPEISCMAAIEAQACGCLPITTDDFALKESVQYGHRASYDNSDEFISTALGVLAKGEDLRDYREAASKWAIETYSATSVASKLLSQFYDTPVQEPAPCANQTATSPA